MSTARIATFNVNSIRARLDNFVQWLARFRPDVVLLQEIKSTEETFPFDDIRHAGYQVHIAGQKSYNGVAILSREPVEIVSTVLPGGKDDDQARWMEARWRDIHVCCLYLPNGNPVPGPKFDYKISWMKRLHAHVETLLAQEVPLLLGGDFNVCPTDDDVWNAQAMAKDALLQPESRDQYFALEHLGLVNALRSRNSKPGVYSYWDYQGGAFQKDNGLLIDHFLLSAELIDRMTDVGIDTEARAQPKASDHTPVWVELEL